MKAFRHDRLTESIAATEREVRRVEDRPTAANAANVVTQAARAIASLTEVSVPTAPSVAPRVVADRAASPDRALKRVSASQLVRRPRAAYVGVALAALAVVAVAVLLWRSSSEPVAPAAQAGASAAPTAARIGGICRADDVSGQCPAPALAQLAPAGPPRALNIEFVTIRPVWARITVDGRRAFEREFTANQRIPLGADNAIVIRAGDAGAIRLLVEGKDLGVLGRDGQVFNRTFTVGGR